MNSITRQFAPADDGVASLASHAGLARYLNRLCMDMGADHYMLLEPAHESAGEATILASNWIYDAVRSVGFACIHRIAQSPRTTAFAAPPKIWRPAEEALRSSATLSLDEAARLEAEGHVEIAAARVRSGRHFRHIVVSAAHPKSISPNAFASAQVALSYALCATAASDQPANGCQIAERERECLRWVSEGKTTEEVATILSVSGNTVNSYITSAMQKMGARNRAMAIATAIRTGLI